MREVARERACAKVMILPNNTSHILGAHDFTITLSRERESASDVIEANYLPLGDQFLTHSLGRPHDVVDGRWHRMVKQAKRRESADGEPAVKNKADTHHR